MFLELPMERTMLRRPLRFASFLAPSLLPVYQAIAAHVGRRLDRPVEWFVGEHYEELARADVSFVCGLAYIELAHTLGLEAVAAPVLRGERYGGRPIYFSDVIVRRESRFRTFHDLRGCSWSFNEPLSQSGYGVTRYHLVRLRETAGFFGKVIEAGFHSRSLDLVCRGQVDASAIDSHVLALALREQPELNEQIRVLGSLGPSTIQPVVVGTWLPPTLRGRIQAAVVDMVEEETGRSWLARGLIERFVPRRDSDYDDLRRMRRTCVAAGFLTLR
jgi:phosphonate transport system substrate-binding protein